MIDNSTKTAILNTILESQDFLASKTYKKLLTYLVEASIQDESPKEYSIAIDVFGKESDFNPNEDTTVRVYIHNLRKKLEHYYRTEGRHNKVVIEIPKGHYEVRFISRSRVVQTFTQLPITIPKVLTIVLVLGLVLISVFLFLKNKSLQKRVNVENLIEQNDPVWSEFLDQNRPVLVVLGDHFFYEAMNKELQRIIRIRDLKINSNQELNEYKSQYPDAMIGERTTTPYFAMNSVWPVADILPILVSFNIPFSFRSSSDLTSHDLTDNDIIFVGSYKTLGVLTVVMNNLNLVMNDESLEIVKDTFSSYQERESTAERFHKDLCAIAKLPGPVGNTILILTSLHATGTSGAAQFLRHPKTLWELEDQFINKFNFVPQYFYAVVEVSGFNHTDFQADVIDFAKVDKDVSIW